MKPASRLTSALLVFLLVTGMAGSAAAQGLDQLFEWPEVGISMNYPAGWGEQSMDSETRILLADPNFDAANSDAPPDSPSVVILALSSDMAAMMGGTDLLLEGFVSEFGGDASLAQPIVVGGIEGQRLLAEPEEGFTADIVLLVGESYIYVLIGIVPSSQNFSDQFTAMLDTVVFSAPTEIGGGTGAVAVSSDVPLVNGVRVTLDQSITGSWNEIDAVELVGIDGSGMEVGQWATGVEATSQYTDDSWSAEQVLGEPNTFECGDISTAWASETSTGYDSLTLYYDVAVEATEINIYETYNPGAVVWVEVLPADGSDAITVWTGYDTTVECPGIFSIPVDLGGSGGSGGSAATMNTIITGSIDNTTYYQDWTFDGLAGDVVTITMVNTGGDLDPLLYLLDASGSILSSNDDADDTSVGAFNSQIVSFTLPASGTFTVRATRFGDDFGSSTGTYELTIETGSGSGPATSTGGVIDMGQTISGTITDSASQQDWTFTGNAGEIVTITMAADGMVSLDAYLQLLDDSGNELDANDDAGVDSLGVFDSQIVGYTLPYSGEYIIRASRLSGTGDYVLTLDAGAAAVTNTIAIGETVSGAITDDAFRQLWAFEGTAGTSVTITMVDASTTPTLDSYLSLLGPDGTEIASNDDAANTSIGAFNAQIANQPLAVSGTYTIVATRFGEEFGSGTGPYNLSLQLSK